MWCCSRQKLKWCSFGLMALLSSGRTFAGDEAERSAPLARLYQGTFAASPVTRGELADVIGRPLAYDGQSGAHMWKSMPFKTADGYAIEYVEARSRVKAENVEFPYVAIHVASSPCFAVGSALPMLGDNTLYRDPFVAITYYVHKTPWGTISMGVPDATPDCVTNIIGTSLPS
jgi:hypothetical protein